jgi:hypothetical protein
MLVYINDKKSKGEECIHVTSNPVSFVDGYNNNNFIVPIKGSRRSRELHMKQILIQCMYI